MKKLLIIIGLIARLNTNLIAGPIHNAAHEGDLEALKVQLTEGVDVDSKDNSGNTPLYILIFVEYILC